MSAIVIWILFCAYLNCVGWTLSALHQLNAGGYAVALTIGLGAFVVWSKRSGASLSPRVHLLKLRRRFRRGFPLAFLILTTLAFLGGALYAPANYDALAYRTPRVLHWLAAGQWHWIHTDFQRLNTRTAGFEWLTAPLFQFSGTDRLVFLLNIISFLLLPGRFFAVLTRLGVRPRTAWHWMWLFPSGYGYVLQAGSVANDMFGALMAFTALEFAWRAREQREVRHLCISLLAAALMTAGKAFNILLLLPWAVVALPALTLLLRRPVISFVIILLAASASILPTAALNWHQCRDWTGLAAEQPTIGGGGKPYRFVANAVSLPLHNLVPPVFPLAKPWHHAVERIMPPKWAAGFEANMEPSLAHFDLPELQIEECAGLGAGLTLLLLLLLAKKIKTGKRCLDHGQSGQLWVPLAAWASLGVFMMQVGAAGPARYLLPFYPLLVAPILTGNAAAHLFHRRTWRAFAFVCFGVTALLLVLSPARPLWPAATVLRAVDAENSPHRLLNRASDVYSAYAVRANGFAPIIAALPPDANPLGLLAFDEPEAALWRPFGSRRIVHFTLQDSAAELRKLGFKYALLSEDTLVRHSSLTPAQWLNQAQAEPVKYFELKLLARQEPHEWMLVRLK